MDHRFVPHLYGNEPGLGHAHCGDLIKRHVRRDGLDVLKRLEKDHKISEDDGKRSSEQVQKATDEAIAEVDKMLATKEREILTV